MFSLISIQPGDGYKVASLELPYSLLVKRIPVVCLIGVRAGGARGAAAPPNFGQLRFFGQREKIWAKQVFKDVSMFI